MASMEYENEQRSYDGKRLLLLHHACDAFADVLADFERVDEPRGYDRDRSRSPRRDLDDSRARSASPNGRDSR
jgi:transformer-2 protein